MVSKGHQKCLIREHCCLNQYPILSFINPRVLSMWSSSSSLTSKQKVHLLQFLQFESRLSMPSFIQGTPAFSSLSRFHTQGVLVVAQWVKNPTSIYEDVGSIPSLASGLRTLCCHILWCESQMQLRSCVAVAVGQASSCSSNSALILGTSKCCTCGPEKKKKDYILKMHCKNLAAWGPSVFSSGIHIYLRFEPKSLFTLHFLCEKKLGWLLATFYVRIFS